VRVRVRELQLVCDPEVDPEDHACDQPEKACQYVETIHFHEPEPLSEKSAAGHAELRVVRQSRKRCASFRE
jgi:hypothetical protein